MLREEGVSGSKAAAPWYADGLQFACTQCGNCCSGAPGYVWVSPDEIDRIAGYRALAPADFARRHVRRVGMRHSLLERADGDCEFLERLADGKTRCTIHPVRPVQCRTWPFWKSNLESREAWAEVAQDCPGMNKGPHFPLPVIQAAVHENGRRPL